MENSQIEYKSQLTKDIRCNSFSVPRNKEIMRIYKDLELVEQLGTGIQRILQVYGKECFIITDHFIKVTFPSDTVA